MAFAISMHPQWGMVHFLGIFPFGCFSWPETPQESDESSCLCPWETWNAGMVHLHMWKLDQILWLPFQLYLLFFAPSNKIDKWEAKTLTAKTELDLSSGTWPLLTLIYLLLYDQGAFVLKKWIHYKQTQFFTYSCTVFHQSHVLSHFMCPATDVHQDPWLL